MIPILLISQNEKQTKNYINNFIKRHKITNHLIFEIKKDKTMIKIDQIRQIYNLIERQQDSIPLTIIYDFETSKFESQNALLKILEDKVSIMKFILVSQNEATILPTIISRTKLIKLPFIEKTQQKMPLIIDKNIKLNEKLFLSQKVSQQKALDYIDDTLAYYFKLDSKDLLTTDTLLLKEILKIRYLVCRNNLNPQKAIDYLILLDSKNPSLIQT